MPGTLHTKHVGSHQLTTMNGVAYCSLRHYHRLASSNALLQPVFPCALRVKAQRSSTPSTSSTQEGWKIWLTWAPESEHWVSVHQGQDSNMGLSVSSLARLEAHASLIYDWRSNMWQHCCNSGILQYDVLTMNSFKTSRINITLLRSDVSVATPQKSFTSWWNLHDKYKNIITYGQVICN
jgi:hypothetical protein